MRDGIIELRGGDGWLRTPDPYFDFAVTFEFRATTPDADAGLILRTWTVSGEWPEAGYRFALPTAATAVSGLFVGRKKRTSIVENGKLELHPTGEWQRVDAKGEGKRITLAVNHTVVVIVEIEELRGFVLFENRRGVVQLRNIELQTLPRDLDKLDTPFLSDELKDAGGEEPVLLHEVRPNYTRGAMAAKVQGRVDMEVLVLPDGSVGPIRITRSLHRELDESATEAVKRWRFKPGFFKGRAVPVLVEVEMTFTLE